MGVDQRAARVAGVHRRVGLDERLDPEIVGNGSQLPRLGAHDAGRDGRLQVERRTDRQHPFAQTQRIGRSESQRREPLGLDLQQGEVRRRVLADEFGIERTAVVELHLEFRGAVHHVVVRDDVAVPRNNDARTARALFAVLRTPVAAAVVLRNAEELQERVVTAPALGHLDLLDSLDVHDGFHRILGGIGQVGILIGLVGGELCAQRGSAFHLALDISYRITAVARNGPRRKSAGCGRHGDYS